MGGGGNNLGARLGRWFDVNLVGSVPFGALRRACPYPSSHTRAFGPGAETMKLEGAAT